MRGYDSDYWVRQGAKIRSIANDIKRNDEALAEELGEALSTVHATYTGAAAPEVVDRIINKMVEVYPLSRLDLEVRRDDTDEGVVVYTPDQALGSSRIFSRANSLGQSAPYYEYRDAAMSALGPYRPEWIKELRIVTTNDPADQDVAYNSGHLMHQATFFVGPVNFYWKIGDDAFVAQMDTGDSNYITPFVPHSFASRDSDREAYIVAVTFAGRLEHIHRDITVLDPKGVEESLLDLSDRSRAFSAILRRELTDSMTGVEQLSRKCTLELSRLEEFLAGTAFPNPDELTGIADALGTNVRDLLPPEVSDPFEVVVQHKSPGRDWVFPSGELPHYQVQSLAGSRKVPFLKSMAVRIMEAFPAAEASQLDLTTSSHEFGYNFGQCPAQLFWKGAEGIREAVVEPGGSYYVKPAVPHALRSPSTSATPEVVVMRVGAGLYGEGHLELSSYPREALRRVLNETEQWYDPSKIGG